MAVNRVGGGYVPPTGPGEGSNQQYFNELKKELEIFKDLMQELQSLNPNSPEYGKVFTKIIDFLNGRGEYKINFNHFIENPPGNISNQMDTLLSQLSTDIGNIANLPPQRLIDDAVGLINAINAQGG